MYPLSSGGDFQLGLYGENGTYNLSECSENLDQFKVYVIVTGLKAPFVSQPYCF